MAGRNCFRLYGLDVCAPFPMTGARSVSSDPDVVIAIGPTIAEHAPLPDGTEVAVDPLEPSRFTTLLLDDGSLFHRVNTVADVTIDRERRRVVASPVADGRGDLVEVVLAGQVLSVVLTSLGELVLHASVVDIGGASLGFVGDPGSGKSTLAAMVCAAGARIVSDDVLRVEVADDGVHAFRGLHDLRLRPTSKALPSVRIHDSSADGRHLFAPDAVTLDRVPLDRLVLPRLVRGDGELIRYLIEPTAALFALLRLMRIGGWIEPVTSSEHFRRCASVVESIPVYSLDVPWGVERVDMGQKVLEILDESPELDVVRRSIA